MVHYLVRLGKLHGLVSLHLFSRDPIIQTLKQKLCSSVYWMDIFICGGEMGFDSPRDELADTVTQSSSKSKYSALERQKEDE